MATRVVILGAAGRDFHNFNVVYRDDPTVTVVAFTATQIPGIAGRRYPASLAGPRYPDGIAIEDESELEALCRRERVTQVVFAYSDVPHATVMHAGSQALGMRRRFRPARSGPHDADRPRPRDRHLRDPHRMRQVAGRPLARGLAARARLPRRRAASPDAVRRSRAPARPAVRVARRPGCGAMHGRGARGV